jgi:hypothetical protein
MSQTADVAPVAAAAAASGLDMALNARAAQMGLRARLMLDVTRLWPLLDRTRVDETWPGWLTAMRTLLTGYHAQSSTLAAGYYQRARHAAATAALHEHHQAVPVGIRHTTSAALTTPMSPLQLEPPVHLAAPPDPQWVTRALGYAGPGQLSKDTARPNTALSTTLGTASRIALEGGRVTLLDTIDADPAAVGWYRVTDAQPCAFCALLASRGVVYKRDSFDQSDPRFHGARRVQGPQRLRVHARAGVQPRPRAPLDQRPSLGDVYRTPRPRACAARPSARRGLRTSSSPPDSCVGRKWPLEEFESPAHRNGRPCARCAVRLGRSSRQPTHTTTSPPRWRWMHHPDARERPRRARMTEPVVAPVQEPPATPAAAAAPATAAPAPQPGAPTSTPERAWKLVQDLRADKEKLAARPTLTRGAAAAARRVRPPRRARQVRAAAASGSRDRERAAGRTG